MRGGARTVVVRNWGKSGQAGWPALVDSIAIDGLRWSGLPATVADAPKKRTTVAGRYQVTTPSLPATVAVRIVDITGGERIVTCRIKNRP